MSGELILVLFFIRHLRKSLPKSSPLQKWNKIFQYVSLALSILLVVEIISIAPVFSRWIAHLIMLSVVAAVYLIPDFRSYRNFVIAALPFVLVAVIKDIVRLSDSHLAHQLFTYINFLYPWTIVWIVAMFFITNRQRKALQKERERRAVEEEQNRQVAARKAELEMMVSERTAELLQQKEELEHALNELRDTQAQLIQSEKMASLGELTAGIAHEIQNPLNFVNNFSDLNRELIAEMKEEISRGNVDEVKAIAGDIEANEAKISHHGKRADAIVKGMLQHSRLNSGNKEPTDINALADEFLRLSYHGLRAKDKSFNANFTTSFDEKVGKVDVVAQDVGRVLLNLFNNAFYSVNEKKKQLNAMYDPLVSVTTKKSGNGVEIIVKDNGNGIPQKVLDKIYQPFFTTKPTGQGTGLGLSLSYDIIKAHAGDIKVDTKEGEGAEFIIQLPAEKS